MTALNIFFLSVDFPQTPLTDPFVQQVYISVHISGVIIPYNYISYYRPCNLSELHGQDLAHYHQSSRNSFSYKHKSDSHSNVIYSPLPMRRRSKQWPLSREGCSTVSWNVPTQRREGFCVYMDERALRGETSAPGQRPPRGRRHIATEAHGATRFDMA